MAQAKRNGGEQQNNDTEGQANDQPGLLNRLFFSPGFFVLIVIFATVCVCNHVFDKDNNSQKDKEISEKK